MKTETKGILLILILSLLLLYGILLAIAYLNIKHVFAKEPYNPLATYKTFFFNNLQKDSLSHFGDLSKSKYYLLMNNSSSIDSFNIYYKQFENSLKGTDTLFVK